MTCCDVPGQNVAEGACGSCGAKGIQVPAITAKALMTADGLRRGIPKAPRFCSSAECPVVYFDDVSSRRVEEQELSVPVYAKHPRQASVPVCYCFGYTVSMVDAGANASERVSEVVRHEVASGHCACEVKNPKGTCCLGDILHIEHTSVRGGP
jgi:hypothetical protein